MASIYQLPSGSWRAQIRRKGVADLGQTFETREDADAWAASKEAELLTMYHTAAPKVAQSGTLGAIVEKYYQSFDFREKAPTTQSRERSCAARVLECLGHYAITTITGLTVQEYLEGRSLERVRHANGKVLDKLVSPDTIRLEKAFLSAVFKWAKERNYITSNIMADTFKLPKRYGREGRISEEQQLKLYEEAMALRNSPGTNPCLIAWLHFIFETGTRPGEAAKIELSWVEIEKRRVHIPRRGSKKRTPRIILLSKGLAPVVAEQMVAAKKAGSNYLFFSRANSRRQKRPDGTPIRRTRTPEESAARECIPYQYYHAWKNLCRHAEMPAKINPHIVRHEFICRLFEKTTLNDSQIAVLVGDVNVLSLEPYKHVQVERLRDHHEAHTEAMRSTLDALEAERQARLSQMSVFFKKVLMEADEERKRNGDYSTPVQRLHAGIEASKVIERAAERAASGQTDEDE